MRGTTQEASPPCVVVLSRRSRKDARLDSHNLRRRKRLTVGDIRTSTQFGQGHLKAASPGNTIWPHFSQICRPFSRTCMSMNPVSETQYGQRGGCGFRLIVIWLIVEKCCCCPAHAQVAKVAAFVNGPSKVIHLAGLQNHRLLTDTANRKI